MKPSAGTQILNAIGRARQKGVIGKNKENRQPERSQKKPIIVPPDVNDEDNYNKNSIIIDIDHVFIDDLLQNNSMDNLLKDNSNILQPVELIPEKFKSQLSPIIPIDLKSQLSARKVLFSQATSAPKDLKSPLLSQQSTSAPPLVKPVIGSHDSRPNESVESDENTSPLLDNQNNMKKKENWVTNLLEKTSDGLCVLSYYETHSKLNNSMRNELADIIVRSELKNDSDRKLSTNYFIKTSEAICVAFPKEVPKVYYVAFEKIGNKRNQAAGKLYNKYNNLRKRYRENGLIVKVTNKSTKGIAHFQYNLDSLTDEEYEELIGWLQALSSPWLDVVEKWSLTAHRRLHEFDNTDLTIGAYMSAFPCLECSDAPDLIQIDFEVKYKGHSKRLIDGWATLRSNIINLAKTRYTEEKYFAENLKKQNLNFQFTSEEDKNVSAILLLLNLLPLGGAACRKRKRGVDTTATTEQGESRWSRQEVIKSFLITFEHSNTFKSEISKRVRECQQEGTRLQGFIVALKDAPFVYYIYFNQHYYVSRDIISAVDLCFKLHMVLNAEYTSSQVLTWTFIQKFIYGIETPRDGHHAALYPLAVDLYLINNNTVSDA